MPKRCHTIKIIALLLVVLAAGCAQQPTAAPALPEPVRAVSLNCLSLAMPTSLQPVNWTHQGWRIDVQPLPQHSLGPAQAFAHWEGMLQERMGQSQGFIGRYERQTHTGIYSLWFVSRTDSIINIEALLDKGEKPLLLRAERVASQDSKPEQAIRELEQAIGEALNPARPLVLHAAPGQNAYFAAQGPNLSLSVCLGDSCANSSLMAPATLGLRMLHGLFGHPDESLGYVRHGNKQAGNLAGTENIFSVARHSKGQSPSYALRAIWQDADKSLSMELRAEDTSPPDTTQFLLQWDALLAGLSRTP